ncbi:Receptor-like serine/threonine-protein kinase [Actinidia chinensis var. chinensis]|uniref:non-specific serine/threonine protein kinase n=1 Tax=Actinidia chinensis var. chinensis TaxID=1590841 RepID=A0A2R6PP30_ACTCC|nr:Receptor-like serine/threonine-protein kinase [Actinidia chinensis var. chinensis]
MEEKKNAYSPNGVLEDYLRTEESETVSSKASTSEIEIQRSSKPASRWRGLVKLLKSRSIGHLANLHPLSVMKLSRRISNSMREDIGATENPLVDTDLSYLRPRRKNFSLSELQRATTFFSHENLIGKGGYAEVYKGQLRDGQLVAIKRLTRGRSEERIGDFLSELGIMAHVNHPNTAKLIGYGVEGGMYLVLELSPHGSLASLLHHGFKERLDWGIRYKVALGAAEGLLYLHEGCQRRIIHRDVKAANILLTEDFEPQICDFGLAKWLPEQWTHHTVSKFEGTLGYLAPEYLMHGLVDEKTDVYAFGVLLLELITGRRALDYSKQSLVFWAKPLLKKNNIRELVDPSLGNDFNTIQMNLVVLAAFLCTQQSPVQRPQMRQIVQLLKGSQGSLEVMKKYQKPSFWKRYYVELFTAEDYNGTRDLMMKKQLPLEA